MKTLKIIVPILIISILLVGCNHSTNETQTNTEASQSQMIKENTGNTKVLIAYFSRIGNIDSKNKVDAISSASVVTQEGSLLGNTEYIAHLIKNVTGGDIRFIETSQKYPSEYDDSDNNALDIQANKENRDKARPQLATDIENIDNYDVVFLGFPNWYGDMPMAVYSFLEQYDLSDKKIYLFNSSGGGGARDAYSKVSELQPNAKVEKNIFSVIHSHVSQLTNENIQDWLKEIAYKK